MLVLMDLATFLIVLAILAPIAALVYWRSIKSRKYYECPLCKERMQVEHMKASHCNVCGAELKETGEKQ